MHSIVKLSADADTAHEQPIAHLRTPLLVLSTVLLMKFAWQLYAPRLRQFWKDAKARLPRRWKPRSPNDCPHCCAGVSLASHPVERDVPLYAKRKSRRGRKKEICTAGFACLNKQCDYFTIIDEAIHALVGNGKRGIRGDIQQFRCQACKTGFTCRRNTPLYYLRTRPIASRWCSGSWPKVSTPQSSFATAATPIPPSPAGSNGWEATASYCTTATSSVSC